MTVTRTLTPGQVAGALRRTDATIRAAQGRAVLEAMALGAELLAREVPVDVGRLKQSFRVRRKGPSGYPELQATAPHAGIVEAGSRPHWAPLRPLVRWVRRHAAQFGVSAATGRDAQGRFTSGGIVRVARAIQRSIAQRGTRPRWYVRRNLPRLGAILRNRLAAAKGRALAALATGGGA